MKVQHHIGGLDGLDDPIDFEKRVFVQDWETRIFAIHAAMMGLSTWQIQPVEAFDSTSSMNNSEGFFQL